MPCSSACTCPASPCNPGAEPTAAKSTCTCSAWPRQGPSATPCHCTWRSSTCGCAWRSHCWVVAGNCSLSASSCSHGPSASRGACNWICGPQTSCRPSICSSLIRSRGSCSCQPSACRCQCALTCTRSTSSDCAAAPCNCSCCRPSSARACCNRHCWISSHTSAWPPPATRVAPSSCSSGSQLASCSALAPAHRRPLPRRRSSSSTASSGGSSCRSQPRMPARRRSPSTRRRRSTRSMLRWMSSSGASTCRRAPLIWISPSRARASSGSPSLCSTWARPPTCQRPSACRRTCRSSPCRCTWVKAWSGNRPV